MCRFVVTVCVIWMFQILKNVSLQNDQKSDPLINDAEKYHLLFFEITIPNSVTCALVLLITYKLVAFSCIENFLRISVIFKFVTISISACMFQLKFAQQLFALKRIYDELRIKFLTTRFIIKTNVLQFSTKFLCQI